MFQRCMQPAQQHGRRMPSLSSVRTLATCCRLVSGFLTEITQQIHSLRASGVISSQAASAAPSEVRVWRKSAGTLCTTPVAISFVAIRLFYTMNRLINASFPFSETSASSSKNSLLNIFRTLNWQQLEIEMGKINPR